MTDAYFTGWRAGAEAVIDHLKAEYPDLDDHEFGGPIRSSEEFLAGVGDLFPEMACSPTQGPSND